MIKLNGRGNALNLANHHHDHANGSHANSRSPMDFAPETPLASLSPSPSLLSFFNENPRCAIIVISIKFVHVCVCVSISDQWSPQL